MRRSVDPTHTTTLRRQFMGEAGRRFLKVAQEIRHQVATLDGFGLRTNRGRFEFRTTAAKIEAFLAWLRVLEQMEILTVSTGTPVAAAGRQAWTAKYIQTAYQKGIADAGRELRGAGARVSDQWVSSAFNRPVHADAIGIIFTRVFTELEGITATMDQQISRVLAQGLAEGQNPIAIAKAMTDRVKRIGRTRARTLARTEVIQAHADATLNAYQEAGADGVEVESEFTTANDSRVCPLCEALEGRVYTLSEARGVIPVHPNCRCAWRPVLPNARDVDLR